MNSRFIKYTVAVGVSTIVAYAFAMFFPKMISLSPMVAVLIPAIMFIALVFVISPLNVIFVILATRCILDPFLQSTRVFAGMGAGAILNLLVILAAGVICFRHFKWISKIPFVRQWLIFLAVTLMSITYSTEGMTAVRLWLNNLTYLSMLCIALVCISSVKDIRRWMFMIVGAATVSVLVALSYAVLNGKLMSRIAYPLTHPSVLAHYVVITLTITATTLLFFIERNAPVRHLLRVALLFLSVALLLTQTRNAWIACWAAFFIFGLMRKNKLVLAVCILVPLLLACLPPVQERILDAFKNQHQTESQGMNSFAWRMTLWSDSWPLILEKPLFGHGLSTFVPSSRIFSKVAQVQGSGAHNVYIELLFEAGIIGLIAYILIFIVLLKQFIFYYKNLLEDRDKGVAALVITYTIGYLIVCAIDNLQQVLVANWYVWFFIGAMYRYLQMSYDKQRLNISTGT